MFFDFNNKEVREIAFKVIDSLPVEKLKEAIEIVEEILNHIRKKVEDAKKI